MHCERCGFEMRVGLQFCGMCGAKLKPLSAYTAKTAEEPAPEKPRGPWSRPSLLGLGEDSCHALPPDDDSGSRNLRLGPVLAMLLVVIGTSGAVWYWRSDLRNNMAGGLAQASTGQSEPINAVQPSVAATPAATPGSSSSQQSTQQLPVQSIAQAPAASTAKVEPAVARVSLEAPQTHGDMDSGRREVEGEKYLYGTGVPVDCNRAQQYLGDAAEDANAKADSVLGTMYATGHCVSRDLPQAYRWFSRAQQQDPANPQLKQNLQMVWNSMTPEERRAAPRSTK